jgi:Leucine-rich repeat (LRR) protein
LFAAVFDGVGQGDLDLSPLRKLQSLNLISFNNPANDAPPLAIMVLPCPAAQLAFISTSSSSLYFDLRCLPALESLDVSQSAGVPFELSYIIAAPNLVSVSFSGTGLNSTAPSPNGSTLMGGELTQYVLSNLWRTNPYIILLDFTATPLVFAADNTCQCVWPNIHSPSLLTFDISQMAQMRTTSAGPPAGWLTRMPALQHVKFLGTEIVFDSVGDPGPRITIHTAAFWNATHLISIDFSTVKVVGDLAPLYGMNQLTTLLLDNSDVQATLPTDVAAVWPQLITFSAINCNLQGAMPSFANLPQLVRLIISGNAFTSIPAQMFEGSTKVSLFTVSDKSDVPAEDEMENMF